MSEYIKVVKVSETDKVEETKKADFIIKDKDGQSYKLTVTVKITVRPLKG